MRLGVQTLLIAVTGLSAIALAVSGCSGGSDAQAESPPATTTQQVATQPPAQSALDISKLRAAFKEAFGHRPWYGRITGMKMTQISSDYRTYGTLEIAMRPDLESETDVGTICEAAFNVAESLGVRDAIEAVSVVGPDGAAGGGCA